MTERDLTSSDIRTLIAVLAVHRRDGRASVRSVMAAAGYRSTNTTWRHLDRLRRAGFVAWVPGTQSTIRPLVEVVR